MEYVPQDRAQDATQLPARELSPEDLRRETELADRLALEYVGRLSEADLKEDMVCQMPEDDGPKEARFPIGDVLWHLVEEELQHRGEINALLWQMNVEPPIAQIEDWNFSKVGDTTITPARNWTSLRTVFETRSSNTPWESKGGGASHR